MEERNGTIILKSRKKHKKIKISILKRLLYSEYTEQRVEIHISSEF